ncbi:MAG TPA: hypothetical protein VGW75_03855 [Solirubrobacteraceae bacterium]|jgi:hypothetical protein|nr:hypothetical protein [Solirubrobacteraceae bacterium]
MSAGEHPEATGLDRRDLLRLGALIAALLAIVAVVLLAGGGGGASPVSLGQVQGVLTEVTSDRLVLQPADGGAPQEFSIRPHDQRRIDLFHLRQHAADALPSIVHYEEADGTRYAVRVDDAPPA